MIPGSLSFDERKPFAICSIPSLLSSLFAGDITDVQHANHHQFIETKIRFYGRSYRHPDCFPKLPIVAQIGIVAFLSMLVANTFFLPEIVFYDRPFYVSANEHNFNTALALQEITTSDATAGVLWAGAIPYFSERNGIDFLGKSDRYIAKLPPDLSGKVSGNGITSLPGHNKYDLSYSIEKLRPTFVQAFKWGGQDLSSWAETRYVRVAYKGLELYLLKDSPAVLWEKLND